MEDVDLRQWLSWLKRDYTPSKQELQMIGPCVRHWWACNSQLQLHDNALYYLWTDAVAERLLCVAPKSLQNEALKHCHDDRMAGHFGEAKTFQRWQKSVIWYGMRNTCKCYVKSFSVCSRNKRANIRAKSGLGIYHAGVPLERIHIDILGPLPTTQQGNKYILVIVDQFTKWMECHPLPCQNAESIACVLVNEFIARFGCPLEIHSDQGRNVDGNLTRHLCKILQITKTRTTPYRPCSNGQVERYNRSILQMLRCYIKDHTYWDLYLQQIARAMRGTTHRQTGLTSTFMMFGKEVLQTLDLMLGTPISDGECTTSGEYVKILMDKTQ